MFTEFLNQINNSLYFQLVFLSSTLSFSGGTLKSKVFCLLSDTESNRYFSRILHFNIFQKVNLCCADNL